PLWINLRNQTFGASTVNVSSADKRKQYIVPLHINETVFTKLKSIQTKLKKEQSDVFCLLSSKAVLMDSKNQPLFSDMETLLGTNSSWDVIIRPKPLYCSDQYYHEPADIVWEIIYGKVHDTNSVDKQ